MLVKSICPQCGAQMEIDDSRGTFFCTFCGTKIENIAQKVEVSGTVHHVIDRSNEPNLIINYASCDQSVLMVTRIVSTGQKNTYMNGQTSTFHLAQGAQTIVLKIGRINYERQIYIPQDNSPVRINASYTGHANISIDQPKWTEEEAEQAKTALTTKPASALSIIAFILSFLVYTSPIALGLGIFDLVKGDKEKKHKLSIAAIIIGGILSLGLLMSIPSCTGKKNETVTNVPNAVTATTTEAVAPVVTEKPTPKPTATPLPTPSPTPDTRTPGQRNAMKSALGYLSFTSFSRQGLIEQLEYEGCTQEDAEYAADNCGADWMEQALKKAKSYLDFSAFSEKGLIEQLEYEKFTTEEATYGADNCGADWMEQALKKAKSYLDFSAFSEKGLIEQLEYEKFTTEEATYGVNNCGADWMEQAVKKGASYLSFMSLNRSGLIKQLKYEGFTQEQAEYGATQNGL